MASVFIKAGREKSLLHRHPWIFSGAVRNVEGGMKSGQTVDVLSHRGDLLARGAYSPHSQITVRIWSFGPEERIGPVFFHRRLERSIRSRRIVLRNHDVTAYRLVNAESDGLPGVIVDRYGDFLVCQFLSAGAEYWKREILSQLRELVPHRGLYERSDLDVREKEGLRPSSGLLCGQEPPDLMEIQEGPVRFCVDIRHGHKTGFYLDQRENRSRIPGFCEDAEVLNCFSYTGGFGVWALKYGAARVTNVESSPRVMQLCNRNFEINDVDMRMVENMEGDAFKVLRRYCDTRRQFDLIVLDPPKFAASRNQLDRASRAYKDINMLAFKLLKPDGVLFTFSCSGAVDADLFQKIVAGAAVDARIDGQILERLSQASDHATGLNFSEGTYLKGLVCRVS
jgi:23S rRNA (cytosine1962-C5)-methyltransferase